MLGYQVGGSLLRLPIHARRLLLRSSPFQCHSKSDIISRTLTCSSQRYYATPGRPRKAVGEPSRPVKRSVKRAAKSTSGGEAQEQNKTRKADARAKKPAAKKAPAKKKAAPKKKELTPEQQLIKDKKIVRAKTADLKKAALDPPDDAKHVSARSMFLKEKMSGTGLNFSGVSTAERGRQLGDMAKRVSSEWKDLTPAELEHYNHLAQQRKQNAHAEFKHWVEQHTVEEIQLANRARAQLKKKLNTKGKKRHQPIQDERAVKRPVTAYLQFSINRQASGDFKHIAVVDRAKLIAQEWRSLSESEKKKYKDLQSQDLNRYSSEYSDVYGHEPPHQHAAAAAA